MPEINHYNSDQYGAEMSDASDLNDSCDSPKFVNEPLLNNSEDSIKPNRRSSRNKHLSTRVLIDALNNLPMEIVARISPNSVKTKN